MKQLKTRLSALVMALVLLVSLAPAAAADDTSDGLEQTAQVQAQNAMEYGGTTSVRYALLKAGEHVLTGRAGV